MKRILEIEYKHFASLEELDEGRRELIRRAKEAAGSSYSPYSSFAVGAAAQLSNGVIINGFNIESEVFPAGICAERIALAHAAAAHPNVIIERIAITSTSCSEECYPCGLCRQALIDVERRQGSEIEVLMAGSESAMIVESAAMLLPFTFKL